MVVDERGVDHDLAGLIRRLQERAADPERRADGRQSAFAADVAGLDVGSLTAQLARAQADVARLLHDGLEVPPPDLVARASELAAQMAAPAEPGLRPPARPADVDTVSTVLGVAVPRVLRRVLTEVADGGFGPGYGLFGTADLVRVAGRARRDGTGLDGDGGDWPADHLPVADLGCGALACVVTSHPDAPVVVFDPDLLEDEDDEVPGRAFEPEAPSLAAWLDRWVASPSPAERETASLQAMAAEIWAREPQDELDHLRRQWLREEGLAPPD